MRHRENGVGHGTASDAAHAALRRAEPAGARAQGRPAPRGRRTVAVERPVRRGERGGHGWAQRARAAPGRRQAEDGAAARRRAAAADRVRQNRERDAPHFRQGNDDGGGGGYLFRS